MKRSFFVLLLPALCLAAPACDRPATAAKKKSDRAVVTASGLQYEDLVVGKGAPAEAGDLVEVHYTGWLTDGKEFDSSRRRNEPLQFRLGEPGIIEGWQQGVAGMKVGGKRKLWIPPDLAYGKTGKGPIPPNAELVFEIELLRINGQPAE